MRSFPWRRTVFAVLAAGSISAAAAGVPHASAQSLAFPARLEPMHVQVNADLVNFPDSKPILDSSDHLQVPLRFLSEYLNYTIKWQMLGSGQVQVSLSKDGRSVSITTGQRDIQVNGRTLTLDDAPELRGSRVYAPLRFFAELEKFQVTWKNDLNLAILSAGGHSPPAIDKPSAPVFGVKPLSFLASAYTSAPGQNGRWGAFDTLGNPLHLGTVAVDPSVIPLGSKLFVEGAKFEGLPSEGFYAIATDTGGAIQGNRLDIYLPFSNRTADNFGFQQVKVYVLGKTGASLG